MLDCPEEVAGPLSPAQLNGKVHQHNPASDTLPPTGKDVRTEFDPGYSSFSRCVLL